MDNLTIHGKIIYLKGGKSSTGRYRTTCVIKAKDFKRHKEQSYLVTFFNDEAKEFLERCKKSDFVRIECDLINRTYPKKDYTLQIIGNKFSLTKWSEPDKRFISLEYSPN